MHSEQYAHILCIKLLNIHLPVLIVCLFRAVGSFIAYCYQVWTYDLRFLLIFISVVKVNVEKVLLLDPWLHHRDELFEPRITKLIFCYGEYQAAFDSMIQTIPNLSFVEGFPENLNDMLCTNCLVIVGDLMSQCSQNQSMSDLFTKGSHHWGYLSCI